jgi:hypothetical protein
VSDVGGRVGSQDQAKECSSHREKSARAHRWSLFLRLPGAAVNPGNRSGGAAPGQWSASGGLLFAQRAKRSNPSQESI